MLIHTDTIANKNTSITVVFDAFVNAFEILFFLLLKVNLIAAHLMTAVSCDSKQNKKKKHSCVNANNSWIE